MCTCTPHHVCVPDPTFYKEGAGASARQYVLWKSDGNAIGKPTPIHIAELDAAGTSVVGAERGSQPLRACCAGLALGKPHARSL